MGDWTYSGPECPDGYANCTSKDETPIILLNAYVNTDAYLWMMCSPDNKGSHFIFNGGGPTIGGKESTGLLIFFTDGPPADGLYYQSYANSEPEWIGFNFEATAGIINFLQRADRANRHISIGVLIADDKGSVLADFDVTGFATNYQRLPCS